MGLVLIYGATYLDIFVTFFSLSYRRMCGLLAGLDSLLALPLHLLLMTLPSDMRVLARRVQVVPPSNSSGSTGEEVDEGVRA